MNINEHLSMRIYFIIIIVLLHFSQATGAQELRRIPTNKDKFTVGASIVSVGITGDTLDCSAPIFRRTIIGEDNGMHYAIAEICYSSDYQTDGYSDKRIFVCLDRNLKVRAVFPIGTTRVSVFIDGISIIGAGVSIDPNPGKEGAMSIDGVVLFDNNQYSTIRLGNGWVAAINPVKETDSYTTYEITYKNLDGRTGVKYFDLNETGSQALVNTIPFIDFDLFDFSNEAKYKQHLSNITNEKTADHIRSLNSFIRAIPE